MQKKTVYDRLVETALAMPKYEPPKYEPVEKPTIAKRVTESLTKKRDVVESAYVVYAAIRRRRMKLSKPIPVSKVSDALADHVTAFIRVAIVRGQVPLNVYIFDRFAAWLDWGHGRYLRIEVEIDTKPTEASTASFVVEPATESDFQQYKREVNDIKSAVIWPTSPNETLY
jgi:hypothetical protein